MRLPAVVPVVACLALLASGCAEDPQADYCEVVEEHQAELSDIAVRGSCQPCITLRV